MFKYQDLFYLVRAARASLTLESWGFLYWVIFFNQITITNAYVNIKYIIKLINLSYHDYCWTCG